jgi:DNA repair protein RadC
VTTVGVRASTYQAVLADMPRERLMTLGAGALSDAEVLSLVLGSDGPWHASRVLTALGGPAGLARASESDLQRAAGLDRQQAAEVIAALELGRRAMRALAGHRPQIMRPADAAALLMPMLAHLDREESVVLVLDRRHRVLREARVGLGGVAHSPMEPREIFSIVLREPGAAALVVAHNHPSGEATPSPEDIAVTRRLQRGAELVGLEFIDHLVIAACGWRSLLTTP